MHGGATQLPSAQYLPASHGCAQVPQLRGSFCRFTQLPAQHSRLFPHAGMQTDPPPPPAVAPVPPLAVPPLPLPALPALPIPEPPPWPAFDPMSVACFLLQASADNMPAARMKRSTRLAMALSLTN